MHKLARFISEQRTLELIHLLSLVLDVRLHQIQCSTEFPCCNGSLTRSVTLSLSVDVFVGVA